MALNRRLVLAAALGALTMPARAVAQFIYETYPKPGSPKRTDSDNSRRVIPAPAADYWPFSGISGAGEPVTAATAVGGWTSGLIDVRYKGPTPRTYPTADWGDADSGSAVTAGLLPPIRPIWNAHIRDPVVCRGPDGYHYMTGTTGDNCWAFNDGIELWRSKDLHDWEYLGLVWSIARDGLWEKNWTMRAGVPFRSIWAPEVHYIAGNFYLCHCMSGVGIGVLKSTTGKATGPYVHVLSNEAIKGGIDPSLFEDDDGRIYLTYGSAEKIREIKRDFSDFEGDWKPLVYEDANPPPDARRKNGKLLLGFEGATIFKANGKYYLGACEHYQGRYSFMFATADHVLGPYTGRHEGPAGAGGGNVFRDHAGKWWQTFFGNDKQMPFREKPGLIAIEFAKDGQVRTAAQQVFVNPPA